MGSKAKLKRNLAKTREKILEATFELVFENGFQGVSIDDIVQKTNLTKGALFHQFPNKLALGYCLVEEVIEPLILNRWIKPLYKFENAIDGILIQVKDLIGNAKPSKLKLGCPLNNLAQEMCPVDSGFRRRIEKAINLWVNELQKIIEMEKGKGRVRGDVDSKQVATFLVMAHEGFYGYIKASGDPNSFKYLYRSLEEYLYSISLTKP